VVIADRLPVDIDQHLRRFPIEADRHDLEIDARFPAAAWEHVVANDGGTLELQQRRRRDAEIDIVDLLPDPRALRDIDEGAQVGGENVFDEAVLGEEAREIVERHLVRPGLVGRVAVLEALWQNGTTFAVQRALSCVGRPRP